MNDKNIGKLLRSLRLSKKQNKQLIKFAEDYIDEVEKKIEAAGLKQVLIEEIAVFDDSLYGLLKQKMMDEFIDTLNIVWLTH